MTHLVFCYFQKLLYQEIKTQITNNQFILLSSFDNAFFFFFKVLKTSDAVEVTYYEMELFDAKLGKFVSYKIVTDITKK